MKKISVLVLVGSFVFAATTAFADNNVDKQKNLGQTAATASNTAMADSLKDSPGAKHHARPRHNPKLDALKKDIAQDQKDIKSDEKDIKKDKQDLKKDVADRNKDNKDIRNDKKDIKSDEKDIKNDRKDIKKDVSDRNKDNKDIKSDKKDLNKDLADRKEDKKEIAQDKEKIKKDSAKYGKNSEQVKKDETKLKHDLADQKRDNKDIKSDKNDLKKDVTDRNKDNKDIRNDKKDVKKDVTDVKNDKKDVKKDIADRNKDNKDIAKDKKDVKKDEADLKKDKKDLAQDKKEEKNLEKSKQAVKGDKSGTKLEIDAIPLVTFDLDVKKKVVNLTPGTSTGNLGFDVYGSGFKATQYRKIDVGAGVAATFHFLSTETAPALFNAGVGIMPIHDSTAVVSRYASSHDMISNVDRIRLPYRASDFRDWHVNDSVAYQSTGGILFMGWAGYAGVTGSISYLAGGKWAVYVEYMGENTVFVKITKGKLSSLAVAASTSIAGISVSQFRDADQFWGYTYDLSNPQAAAAYEDAIRGNLTATQLLACGMNPKAAGIVAGFLQQKQQAQNPPYGNPYDESQDGQNQKPQRQWPQKPQSQLPPAPQGEQPSPSPSPIVDATPTPTPMPVASPSPSPNPIPMPPCTGVKQDLTGKSLSVGRWTHAWFGIPMLLNMQMEKGKVFTVSDTVNLDNGTATHVEYGLYVHEKTSHVLFHEKSRKMDAFAGVSSSQGNFGRLVFEFGKESASSKDLRNWIAELIKHTGLYNDLFIVVPDAGSLGYAEVDFNLTIPKTATDNIMAVAKDQRAFAALQTVAGQLVTDYFAAGDRDNYCASVRPEDQERCRADVKEDTLEAVKNMRNAAAQMATASTQEAFAKAYATLGKNALKNEFTFHVLTTMAPGSTAVYKIQGERIALFKKSFNP